MTLRPNSVVSEVLYDADTKRATGVRLIDAETQEVIEYKAKVIFLCASTVASTSILMQSTSDRFPNGMGNDSGELGHNLMDHHFRLGATATVDGHEDKYYTGRRPNGIYIEIQILVETPTVKISSGDTAIKEVPTAETGPKLSMKWPMAKTSKRL